MYSDAYVRNNKRMKMMAPDMGYSMASPPIDDSRLQCVACLIVFSSMNELHWHQTYRHTTEELSLAVLGYTPVPKQPNPAEKTASFCRKQNVSNPVDYSVVKPMTSMTVPVDYGANYEINDKKTWMMNKSPENYDNKSWMRVTTGPDGCDKRTWSNKNADDYDKKTWLINSSPEIYGKKSWATNSPETCSKRAYQNNNPDVYDRTSWTNTSSPEIYNNKHWSMAVNNPVADDKKSWLSTSQSPEMYDKRSWSMMNKSPAVDDTKSWSSMSLSPETMDKRSWSTTCKSPEIDDKQSWSTVSKSPEVFDKESWSTMSKSPDDILKREDVSGMSCDEPQPSTSGTSRLQECSTSQQDDEVPLDPLLVELQTIPEIPMEDFYASVDSLCLELTELQSNPKSRLKSNQSWKAKYLKRSKNVQ